MQQRLQDLTLAKLSIIFASAVSTRAHPNANFFSTIMLNSKINRYHTIP